MPLSIRLNSWLIISLCYEIRIVRDNVLDFVKHIRFNEQPNGLFGTTFGILLYQCRSPNSHISSHHRSYRSRDLGVPTYHNHRCKIASPPSLAFLTPLSTLPFEPVYP